MSSDDLERRAARLYGDDCSPSADYAPGPAAHYEEVWADDDPRWARLANQMAREREARAASLAAIAKGEGGP